MADCATSDSEGDNMCDIEGEGFKGRQRVNYYGHFLQRAMIR